MALGAERTCGHVLSVSGSQASVGLPPGSIDPASAASVTVGKFLRVQRSKSLLIGMITEVTQDITAAAREQGFRAAARLDMMGEIRQREDGSHYFQRGVTDYPAIGDPAALITRDELRLIYDVSRSSRTIDIGQLQQDETIGAYVNVDDMLSKHFAVLGTTGVGKSSGVALLLRQILEARPNLRLFLLDGHNEYARCFGDKALVLNPRNLRLPFWLFNFEETIDVIFGGRPGVDEEVSVLAELIPVAKSNYTQNTRSGERPVLKRTDSKATGFTCDTPVPYRLADLVALIDERMGKLENRSSRMIYHKLIQRIETVRLDPRYAFMFDNANVGGDTMSETIRQLFRLPADGKPMTIMQLAGFPAEVVDSVVSVLGRMAFDFGMWSDGAFPLLFVCEEAHRYASADRSVGFGPTRRALSRIAKEGRKYGVFLGLVTQRPAELDSTIISQCSTLFAMRMANERDQAIVRSAVSDAAANLLAFVPSLGTREVLAFGEGVALPTRLKFKQLPPEHIPQSQVAVNAATDPSNAVTEDFIDSIVSRWRGASMSKMSGLEGGGDFGDFARDEFSSLSVAPQAPTVLPQQPSIQPAAPAPSPAPPFASRAPAPAPAAAAAPRGLDPDRFRLLKKPLDGGSAAPGAPSAGAGSPPPWRR
ncbi:MAG: ATP-binding protein [Alphaproteobacteria bacterium]|nr:ATP-binding protein [Alphaproteobacteria bacterium]